MGKPPTCRILSMFPFSSYLLATVGSVSASSEASFLNVLISMKRCSSPVIPMPVMFCTPRLQSTHKNPSYLFIQKLPHESGHYETRSDDSGIKDTCQVLEVSEEFTEGSLGLLMGRGLVRASGCSHCNQALRPARRGKIVSVATSSPPPGGPGSKNDSFPEVG